MVEKDAASEAYAGATVNVTALCQEREGGCDVGQWGALQDPENCDDIEAC
jgi:hypothetical protein